MVVCTIYQWTNWLADEVGTFTRVDVSEEADLLNLVTAAVSLLPGSYQPAGTDISRKAFFWHEISLYVRSRITFVQSNMFRLLSAKQRLQPTFYQCLEDRRIFTGNSFGLLALGFI